MSSNVTFRHPFWTCRRSSDKSTVEPKKYSIGSTVSASTAVIETIASINGIDPIDLVVPLYEVVDPDALDSLIQSSHAQELEIHFEYMGHDVCVSSAGEFTVTKGDS